MSLKSSASQYRQLCQFSDGPFPALTVRHGRCYLARHPESVAAWTRVGIALVELARYEEAKQALAKAIDLCPLDKRQIPLSQMGHLFLNAGDYNQAATWYRQAIEADPHDASYRIYLGSVLAKQGHLHEAEEVHRAATVCADGCIDEAFLNLGFVLRALERFAEAAECFREAIRLDPKYRVARQALRDVERCMEMEKLNPVSPQTLTT